MTPAKILLLLGLICTLVTLSDGIFFFLFRKKRSRSRKGHGKRYGSRKGYHKRSIDDQAPVSIMLDNSIDALVSNVHGFRNVRSFINY
ncbi:Uncharacterised protein g2416 [Pycnogonum litorale]